MPGIAPCLNDDKAVFARMRVLQTLLGGMRLWLPTRPPWYVILFQLLVFAMPVLLGIVLCAALGDDLWVAAILMAVLLPLQLVALQVWQWFMLRDELTSIGGVDLLALAAIDGDVEFDSFAAADTIRFLVPAKTVLQTIAAALVAAVTAMAAVFTLHPVALAGSAAAMSGGHWTSLIWGWIVVGTGVYSLTAAPPPEMAQFDPGSGGHQAPTAFITRPAHIVLLALPSAITTLAMDGRDFALAGNATLSSFSSACNILIFLLPALWLAGFMPPLRALLEVLLELSAAELLGTPATFSTAALATSVFASAAVAGIALLLAATAGPALAVAVCPPILFLLHRLVLPYLAMPRHRRSSSNNRSEAGSGRRVSAKPGPRKVIPVDTPTGNASRDSRLMNTHNASYSASSVSMAKGMASVPTTPPSDSISLAMPSNVAADGVTPLSHPMTGLQIAMDALVWVLLTAGCIVFALLEPKGCVAGASSMCDLADILVVVALCVTALIWLLSALQRPFLLGLLRNCMWDYTPASDTDSTVLVSGAVIGTITRVLGPILSIAIACWAVLLLPTDVATVDDVVPMSWTTVLFAAAACRIGQRALCARASTAVEIGLLYWMASFDSSAAIASGTGWAAMPLWARLLLCGAVARRLPEFWNKMNFVWVHMYTSITEEKLRYKGAVAVFAISCLLFPVLFALIGISTLFMSPLLPILGLPVFLPAFPRPRRQWRTIAPTAPVSSTDAALYAQLVPELIKAVPPLVARGVLGELEAGNSFLIRFDSLVAIMRVLQAASGRMVVSIDCLEQQEPTSCHRVEGNMLDEVMNQINAEHETSASVNKHATHTLQPLVPVPVKAYTTSSMKLDPFFGMDVVLDCVDAYFYRALCLLLHEHMVRVYDGVPHDWTTAGVPGSEMRLAMQRLPVEFIAYLEKNGRNTTGCLGANSGSNSAGASSGMPNPAATAAAAAADESPMTTPTPVDTRRIVDDDAEEDDFQPRTSSVAASVKSAMRGSNGQEDDLDELLAMLDDDDTAGPVRSIGLGAGVGAGTGAGTMQKPHRSKPAHAPAPAPARAAEPRRKAPAASNRDPVAQFHHIAASCYSIIQVSGLGCCSGNAVSAGPAHIVEVFKGGVPNSLSSSWLESRDTLRQLCLQAYRIAVGAALESANNFECDEVLEQMKEATEEHQEEQFAMLHRFKDEWYLGLQTDAGWLSGMKRRVPHLLSVVAERSDTGQQEYRADFVSLRRGTAFIGTLNHEALLATWASLAQELLYFTNDDEERYSIQAHKLLLRNLSIQAAQPPLGYPVWTSGPVSIAIPT